MKGKQQYLFQSSRNPENIKERWKITLPLDTLILLSLTTILLLILAFSLGVEKGRRLAQQQVPKQRKVASLVPMSLKKAKAPEITLNEHKVAPVVNIEAKSTTEAISEVPKKGEYYVQVASFAENAAAKKEIERLENNGYPALTLKKGKYIAVYVGGFETSQEARKSLKSLRKKYKDCILRRL